jgi:hypothetical protein
MYVDETPQLKVALSISTRESWDEACYHAPHSSAQLARLLRFFRPVGRRSKSCRFVANRVLV